MKYAKILLALSIAAMPALSFAATATGTTATGASALPTTSLHEELNVPGAPILVSNTETSVTLSWTKVPAATSYIVKYSKTSVAEAFKIGKTDATYEVETDPVISTGTTVPGLKSGLTYYFSVVGIDKDSNEAPTNSEELAVTLSATGTTATGAKAVTTASGSVFKIASVTAVDTKRVEVTFNSPVSTETPVTLKLVKTSDKSAVATSSVAVDPLDSTKVVVSLASELLTGTSYDVTVISAKNAEGTPIQAGVDAAKTFATSVNLKKAGVAGLNAAPSESGSTASGSSLSGAVSPTDAKALPATGTEQNFIFALAAILSLGIVYAARRKRA